MAQSCDQNQFNTNVSTSSLAFKANHSNRSPEYGDFKNPEFDVPDILAATTVDELTFAEVLAALQQTGRRAS